MEVNKANLNKGKRFYIYYKKTNYIESNYFKKYPELILNKDNSKKSKDKSNQKGTKDLKDKKDIKPESS